MRTAAITLGIAGLAGLGLRIWALTGSLGALDGDEAVWGLMSLHVLDGRIPAFFWAQEYGGAHEVLLSSLVVAAAGAKSWAIRIVPVVLFAFGVWLVRELGRETIGEPAASYAAAATAVWPAYVVWKTTRAHGFYGSGLVLSLLAVLLAVTLSRRFSHGTAALLGFTLGFGLYASPQVGLVGIPALGWLVATRPRVLRATPAAAGGAVLGALPWLVWNARHGWASFDRAVETEGGTYVDRLHGFASPLLPTELGLRVPFSLEWLGGPALGWTLYTVLLAALAWAALRVRGAGGVLVAIAVGYPFLFALSPFAWFTEEPRYLVFLTPVLALLLASVVARWRAAPALVAGLLALSAAGLAGLSDAYTVDAGGAPMPRDRTPLVRALDRAGIRHAVADYSLAYALTFETEERIVAAPPAQARSPAQQREVLADRRRARVTVAGSPQDRAWNAGLIGARRLTAGGFAIYLGPSGR